MTRAWLPILVLLGGLDVRLVGADASGEIGAAVLPLPDQLRGGAGVVRLKGGIPETLRESTNKIVCIADLGNNAEFDVRCYQQDFIAVVYRGFQLRAQGLAGAQVEGRILEEIKSGKIKLPPQPTAGYRCLGPANGHDQVTNALTSEIRCWQSIHFPFRTAHEMGLMDESEIPASMRTTMPYVMSSGKYWSHVMIEHTQSAADPSHTH
jgi:hypothetical protein